MSGGHMKFPNLIIGIVLDLYEIHLQVKFQNATFEGLLYFWILYLQIHEKIQNLFQKKWHFVPKIHDMLSKLFLDNFQIMCDILYFLQKDLVEKKWK